MNPKPLHSPVFFRRFNLTLRTSPTVEKAEFTAISLANGGNPPTKTSTNACLTPSSSSSFDATLQVKCAFSGQKPDSDPLQKTDSRASAGQFWLQECSRLWLMVRMVRMIQDSSIAGECWKQRYHARVCLPTYASSSEPPDASSSGLSSSSSSVVDVATCSLVSIRINHASCRKFDCK